MSALLNLPVAELLRLWSELEQCYHGAHGFGGDTAEIYAYRLQRHAPIRCQAVGHLKEEAEREAATEAEDILHAVLTLFAQERECVIEVDGYALNGWRPPDGFSHRVHVRVTPWDGRA